MTRSCQRRGSSSRSPPRTSGNPWRDCGAEPRRSTLRHLRAATSTTIRSTRMTAAEALDSNTVWRGHGQGRRRSAMVREGPHPPRWQLRLVGCREQMRGMRLQILLRSRLSDGECGMNHGAVEFVRERRGRRSNERSPALSALSSPLRLPRHSTPQKHNEFGGHKKARPVYVVVAAVQAQQDRRARRRTSSPTTSPQLPLVHRGQRPGSSPRR